MRGRDEDDCLGDEAGEEYEEFVLPTPYVAEERALRSELERLNGTRTNGKLSVIKIPRSGGGWIYLSGLTTLFSNFWERAYGLGANDSEHLIKKCPTVLKGAKVVLRDRTVARGGAVADQGLGDRWRQPVGTEEDRGRALSGSGEDTANEPPQDVESKDCQSEAHSEENQGHQEANDANE
jgi:hypothetical protein